GTAGMNNDSRGKTFQRKRLSRAVRLDFALWQDQLRKPRDAHELSEIFITQIVRDKLLALINITGLAAGLASCILIALFVVHELRYDAFFRNADDIHRLSFQVALPDNTISTSSVPGPVGPLLQEAS